ILIFLDIGIQTALITSLGATAFTVFSQPRHFMSAPRSILGGYAVGILCGILFGNIVTERISIILPSLYSLIIGGALAVGAAIFVMAATNTEHPPAAGIALGLTLNEWNFKTIIFIIAAVSVMALIRRLFKPVMINLIGSENIFRKSGLKLISPEFENSGKIPHRYTKEGENISPPLVIENVLPSVKSFVLKFESYKNIFKRRYHLIVWDIPSDTRKITKGSLPEGIKGLNSFNSLEYAGPRRSLRKHSYLFKLYGLDTKLNLPEGEKISTLEKAMEGHIVQGAELEGKY
ncbi:MAG: YbhB/YbcL family Raf kinase inhibitor-like protein, partial [Elusimicrobiota bacterium]|nr:YbhB/YbcL family Raf kinase inhibitor-like protein [Elusimicrobiota bacterium]